MMSKKALFRTHADYFDTHPATKAAVKKIFAAMGFLLLAFLVIRKVRIPLCSAKTQLTCFYTDVQSSSVPCKVS